MQELMWRRKAEVIIWVEKFRGFSTSSHAALLLVRRLTLFFYRFCTISVTSIFNPLSMGKKTELPDAWDDDWEAQADNADEAANVAAAEEQVKISKAERLAKHAELNKQIWQSA